MPVLLGSSHKKRAPTSEALFPIIDYSPLLGRYFLLEPEPEDELDDELGFALG
jgi:hypothetical protein